MKFAIASVALFVATAVGQALQINTPANVVECQPTLISWSGGTPPYFLSILPGNTPGAAALQDLGQQTGTSITWTANIAAGTSIGLTLRDSTGAIAQSAAFTINPGSSSACLTSSGSSSAAGSSSVSVSSASDASSSSISSSAGITPAATTPATTPATSGSSTSHTTSTSSTRTGTATGAAASSSSGAGKVNVANMGVAGVVGAALMAILA